MDTNPQVIFMWRAPLRPYKKKRGQILRFYLALALLISLIVFFFGDRILLVPIWAIIFLFYVLTITPPPEVDNKINVFGIETAGITLRWEMLSYFYFTKRFGFDVLTIVSHAPYFYHAYLVVPDEAVKIRTIKLLSEHLIYQEKPRKNITDRMIDWMSALLPDDEDVNEKPKEIAGVSQKPQPASP